MSPGTTSYRFLIVTIGLSHRFRSAPGCSRQMDGRNLSSKQRHCALKSFAERAG